jgi:precorrin-6B methylase 2
MGVNDQAAAWLKDYVAGRETLSADDLNLVLRRMGIWRSTLIANTYVARHGTTVMHGPFAGMTYVAWASEGALAPRLLGAYEAELHPHLLAFAAEGVDCVIDVGCAEGYYAVGLARLIPGATVHAFDINENARRACEALAALNGVGDRVIVGAAFDPADFEAFAGRNALVVVDIEGAEDDLLDPAASPALAGMRLIVETHDLFRPGVSQRLRERFAATHDITVVAHQPNAAELPSWLNDLTHMDRLLAVWEWRSGPTPWLVMRPKG